MANRIDFFMTSEDEAAFFRMLEPWGLLCCRERYEAGTEPWPVEPGLAETLDLEACYLVLKNGQLVTNTLKRGQQRGWIEVDAELSDAIHYERCLVDEDGALRSGRVWAEFDLVGDRMHRQTKPFALRAVLEEMRGHFKKRFLHSDPKGYFIGPLAARRSHEGLELRVAGRKGGVVKAYR